MQQARKMLFEGKDIAYLEKCLPDPGGKLDDYKKLKKKVNAHFLPRRNKYLARYLFLKMRPRTGQQTVEYAIRLKEQAIECEFGNNYEESIFEQLIMTVKNEKTIQKCIRKNWDLSELLRKSDEGVIYLYRCLASEKSLLEKIVNM